MTAMSPLMRFLRLMSPSTAVVTNHKGYSCGKSGSSQSCSLSVEVSRFSRRQDIEGIFYATRHLENGLVGIVCWDIRPGAHIERWNQ